MKSYSKSSSPAAQARRNSAIIRQSLRTLKSDQQQLQALEDRGHGHCKEAQRLRNRIDAQRVERKARRAARARRP